MALEATSVEFGSERLFFGSRNLVHRLADDSRCRRADGQAETAEQPVAVIRNVPSSDGSDEARTSSHYRHNRR